MANHNCCDKANEDRNAESRTKTTSQLSGESMAQAGGQQALGAGPFSAPSKAGGSSAAQFSLTCVTRLQGSCLRTPTNFHSLPFSWKACTASATDARRNNFVLSLSISGRLEFRIRMKLGRTVCGSSKLKFGPSGASVWKTVPPRWTLPVMIARAASCCGWA